MARKKKQSIVLPRPPVVAVLGHVDHGKTTLLDTIRKTDVASREHGGITQHIGAYQVSVDDGKIITFIDTPGHEAFIKMRSRGASVADVAILVVAADDSVMPQTKESIAQIKAAGIPMIVAVNKIDLPTANIEKVKQDLAKAGVQAEGFGGDIPIVAISAKRGTGMKELIDLIFLVSAVSGITTEPFAPLELVIIETKLDKGKGMVATAIIKKGTLTLGASLYEYDIFIGKVRAMIDDKGNRVDRVTPGKPVEILGFSKLPSVGTVLHDVPVKLPIREAAGEGKPKLTDIPDFLKPIESKQESLSIIMKADTAGSLETICSALDPRIKIVNGGMGAIGEADILLAKSCNAFVIGFNVKITSDVEKLAYMEKVVVKTYTIIYELLDELSEVVSGMKEVLVKERELGKGIIIAEFPYENIRVAGTKVVSGRLARGDSVKITRDDKEIDRAKIKSMRHQKEEINKAEIHVECGIVFDKKVDFKLQDGIIAFTE